MPLSRTGKHTYLHKKTKSTITWAQEFQEAAELFLSTRVMAQAKISTKSVRSPLLQRWCSVKMALLQQRNIPQVRWVPRAVHTQRRKVWCSPSCWHRQRRTIMRKESSSSSAGPLYLTSTFCSFLLPAAPMGSHRGDWGVALERKISWFGKEGH